MTSGVEIGEQIVCKKKNQLASYIIAVTKFFSRRESSFFNPPDRLGAEETR